MFDVIQQKQTEFLKTLNKVIYDFRPVALTKILAKVHGAGFLQPLGAVVDQLDPYQFVNFI